MKKQTPHITDEHIVAYLDGELNVSPEFERELHANPELHQAAAEYAVLGKAMALSAGDSRFMLSAPIDARAQKALSGISKSRNAVRTASPAPLASPARPVSPTRSIKYLWAKRTGVGLAFATLLAFLFINYTGKNEQITQVPVPIMKSTPAPQQQTPAPAALPSAVAKTGEVAMNVPTGTYAAPAKHNLVVTQNTVSKDLASNTTSPEAPRAAASEQEKADPAAIMISHRYAKMIKSTPVVEVTQQDRMIEPDRM